MSVQIEKIYRIRVGEYSTELTEEQLKELFSKIQGIIVTPKVKVAPEKIEIPKDYIPLTKGKFLDPKRWRVMTLTKGKLRSVISKDRLLKLARMVKEGMDIKEMAKAAGYKETSARAIYRAIKKALPHVEHLIKEAEEAKEPKKVEPVRPEFEELRKRLLGK